MLKSMIVAVLLEAVTVACFMRTGTIERVRAPLAEVARALDALR